MPARPPEARLADSLALVAPALPPELVSATAAAALAELAATLPPVHVAGFECRLAEGDDAVDLQQAVFARDDAPAAMARSLDAAGELTPAWARVRRICSEWPEGVNELWLEFDPEPSVFAVLAHGADARAVLPALVDSASDPVLDRFVAAVTGPARVSHLGAMLGRPGAALRIHVADVPLGEFEAFLREVGWPGDSSPAVELGRVLLDHGDQVVLCFDVLYGELLPRLGLECFFSQQQGLDPRWRPLLARLVDLELCAPDKADALLRWPGAVTPLDPSAPWPDDLVVASLARPADELGLVERRLSHVKLTLAPNAPVSAKAYFGFGHVWAQPTAPPPDPRPAPAQAPAASVDDAIERAVEFLMRRRNQAGWWRDFFDRARPRDADRRMTGYASDEWVTAYVANAMALAPVPAAREAAREAFELLMLRRESGGWGYHALLPADGDTTTWVLRLARLLDAPGSARLRAARDFVAGLTSPAGAVATYARSAVPHLREFLNMDGTYDGWCGEHGCVTAAAAALAPESLACVAAAQQRDGSWAGHWWDDDEYTTARALEALAPHPEHANHVARGVAWAAARTEGSPFATALAIQAVVAGGGPPQPAQVDSLLATQRADGSWEPSARLRVPAPDAVDPLASPETTLTYVDDDALFTSATVLWALSSVASRA
jgi:hypothetical protein